jgi:hypothetical protein
LAGTSSFPDPTRDNLQPFSISHPDGAPPDATLSAGYFFDGADYQCDGSGPWNFKVSAMTAGWNIGQSGHACEMHGSGRAVCTYTGGQTADGHFGPTDASKLGSTVTVELRF